MANPDTPPPAAAPPPQTRAIGLPLATTLSALASLIGLVILAWAVLYVTRGRFLRGTFERIASANANREVRVAGDFQLYFDPITLKFVAERITVANPAWAGTGNVFEAKRIATRIATPTLIFGKRRVNELLLEDGRLDLEWDAAGKRNTWTFSEEKGAPLELPIIRSATVSGTRLRYRDRRMRIAADLAFKTVEARDTRFASAIRFAGDGTARGTPFTLSGALLSPNATVAGGQNRLELHAEGVRTRIDVAGTLHGATDIEGANLHIDARGRNLADVFALAGVAVPETRAYRLTSALTKAGDEWRFTGLRGRFGDSDLAGKLVVALKEPRLLLTADLATRVLDIVDVAPFIGYNPDDVAARGAAGAMRMVGGSPRLLPDSHLRVDALSNFDAKVRYTVAQVRARSLPVSDIALTLDLDDRLLNLSPLTFTMARGHVAADIAIDARRTPVFTDYDVRLSPTPMGTLLAGWGVEQSGTTGTLKARIKMTGSGDSVASSLATANGRIAVILPKGAFWTRNIQLSELDVGTFVQKMFEKKLKEPVQINCGLIGFTVRGGVAAADPILIDTQKNVMLGRGGFSFRTETIDLAFRADSKRFSIFAGQSPVAIDGVFAKPGFNPISPELLARAGAGIGLGLIASPLAAVIAFVDIGDAKAADCGPILAGASARGQRTTGGKPRDDVGRGTTATDEDGRASDRERKEQRKKFLGIF